MVVDAICIEHDFADAREAAAYAEAFAKLPIVERVERDRGHVVVTFEPYVREAQALECAAKVVL